MGLILILLGTAIIAMAAYYDGYQDGAENTNRLGLEEVKRQFNESPWYRVTIPERKGWDEK